MDLSSERFTTLFFTVFSIAFPLLFIVTLTYQNAPFHLFQGFSSRVEFNTQETLQNLHEIEAPQAIETGRSGNTTTLAVGSGNESFQPTSIHSDDKLLKGLLAPGFDEHSCLSRYKSYLYRKSSPHRPSPYLISKLRDYENLHQRCGLHTKSYNTTISRLINSSNVNDSTMSMCKYLVWTGANGLGNRMVSMVASFLYAILTDRVFLVEFYADMAGLFCEPFPNSSWILSQDFSHVIHSRHIQTYQRMLKSHKGINLSPSFLDLNLQHGLHDHERLFHCDNNQDLLHKVPVLILRSDQYFVPSLFMVSSFKQELNKMFPEKDTVFLHLGHYLFHPSNKAWGLISKIYHSHLAKADERIGLQIRVFHANRTSPRAVVDEILACTLRNNLLPELMKMQKSVTSELKNHTSLTVILVASLHSEYSEMLKTMYVARTKVGEEIIDVFQPSHEGHQEFNNEMHNVKALAEMYLLSLCDVLVSSRKSTFGYVAQGLGGLKPWILGKVKANGVRNPPCKKAISMEPCFHYPSWQNSCFLQNTVLKNVTSLFPHIRHCEDFGWGIKLVG